MARKNNRTPKVEWAMHLREKFESKLVRLGWRAVGVDPWQNPIFRKGTMDIITDAHGIFIFLGGLRCFGLSDERVNLCTTDILKPLCQNPFKDTKKFISLNLATGEFGDLRN